MIREAIVLAGGFGTRLGAMVSATPKPMLRIGDTPFLALLLRHLEKQGIARVTLSVGYLHETVVRYFGDRFSSLELHYCIESQPLGTGGAIAHALGSTQCDSAFVINGDTFLDLDYAAMAHAHAASGSPLSLAVRKVEDVSRYGEVIVTGGHITQFREKGLARPGLVNSGVYLLQRDIFEPYGLPAVFSFEREFLQPIAIALKPLAFAADGYFIDIGIPEDYARAQGEMGAFAA
jgi:D-glycero-alpha-D-manno-heptose 1-phosphate guanylyltransferase